MPAPGEASKGAEGQRKGDGESGGEAVASKEGHENVDLGVKDVNGQANGGIVYLIVWRSMEHICGSCYFFFFFKMKERKKER